MPRTAVPFPDVTGNHERKVSRWISRLEDLYESTRGWLGPGSEWQADVTWAEQPPEEILRRAGVPLREVPNLTLRRGDKEVRFLPNALWVIGANGRLDVQTPARNYLLIDCNDDEAMTRDWQVVTPESRTFLKSFDQAALRRLLKISAP